MNYYPHHIGDYAKDASHLTLIEDGAYRRMMDVYYATEKPLPLDRKALYRLVRIASKGERAAVDSVLQEFFKETPQGWVNKRCDEEIGRAKEKSAKASASAAMRWHCDGNANAYADAQRTQCEGNAPNNQEPITKDIPRKRGSPKKPLPEDFKLSNRVIAWAESRGIENIDRHFENFVGVAKAKGYVYADWDQALMNAVTKDWAKIGDGRRRVAL